MKKILLSTIACATMMLAANSDYKYEITHEEYNSDFLTVESDD